MQEKVRRSLKLKWGGNSCVQAFNISLSFYWQQVHAVVGSSLGGMSSLLSAALYPDRVGR